MGESAAKRATAPKQVDRTRQMTHTGTRLISCAAEGLPAAHLGDQMANPTHQGHHCERQKAKTARSRVIGRPGVVSSKALAIQLVSAWFTSCL